LIRDPVFGPSITFGAGGTAVEIHRDKAVVLPPVNEYISERLIGRTRISKMLGQYRNLPPIDMSALIDTLHRVSEMACELSRIRELDINPLVADENGVMALDVRIAVDHESPTLERYAHMAIHPYPGHLSKTFQLSDGKNITIRPIRPEDAEIEREFVKALSPQAKYFRFMQALQELTPQMLIRFTQIDYDRELALIAVTEEKGKETEVAVARYSTKPDGNTCEFAIVVADNWQRKGIGQRLMLGLMEAARNKGFRVMDGEILSDNKPMIKMMTKLGFHVETSSEDSGIMVARKEL
jgi:acetyltransferase